MPNEKSALIADILASLLPKGRRLSEGPDAQQGQDGPEPEQDTITDSVFDADNESPPRLRLKGRLRRPGREDGEGAGRLSRDQLSTDLMGLLGATGGGQAKRRLSANDPHRHDVENPAERRALEKGVAQDHKLASRFRRQVLAELKKK